MAADSTYATVSQRSPSWAESTIAFSGWLAGTLLVSLSFWLVIPMLALGWSPMVVVSGSMAPLIRTGDVVMVDPAFGSPGEGSVVAFESGGDVMIHRIVSVEPDGALITQGDANLLSDSSPLTVENVIGTGRLLIPHIGLVRVIGWAWWGVVLAVGTMAVIYWRSRPMLSTLLVAILIGLTTTAVVNAVFTTATSNTGSSLAAIDIEPPTDLVASCGAIGSEHVEVDLSWTASSTTEVTGYRVQYQEPDTTNWAPIGTVGSSETTFTHSIEVALLGLGTHTYAVEAVANTWASEFSNTDAVEITEALGVYVCTEL